MLIILFSANGTPAQYESLGIKFGIDGYDVGADVPGVYVNPGVSRVPPSTIKAVVTLLCKTNRSRLSINDPPSSPSA